MTRTHISTTTTPMMGMVTPPAMRVTTPTMRAIRQDVLGGPEVLQEVDVPRPKPGISEILVRVHAASVNPTDWKHRATGRFLGNPPDHPGQTAPLQRRPREIGRAPSRRRV